MSYIFEIAMMGLGMLMPIEKVASGGAAPPGGSIALKLDFSTTGTSEALFLCGGV